VPGLKHVVETGRTLMGRGVERRKPLCAIPATTRCEPALIVTPSQRHTALSASPATTAAPDDVRYLGQFGEHILTLSFTARDPLRTLARQWPLAAVDIEYVWRQRASASLHRLDWITLKTWTDLGSSPAWLSCSCGAFSATRRRRSACAPRRAGSDGDVVWLCWPAALAMAAGNHEHRSASLSAIAMPTICVAMAHE
jgi:hypothetical protein